MHIIFMAYCSPKKHEHLIEHVNNNIVYDYEGVGGRGVHQPFLSEVRLYDVRIKEEFKDQFMADLGISALDKHPKSLSRSGRFMRWLRLALRPLYWFTPFTMPEKDPVVKPIKAHGLPGWRSFYAVAFDKDLYDGEGGEIL